MMVGEVVICSCICVCVRMCVCMGRDRFSHVDTQLPEFRCEGSGDDRPWSVLMGEMKSGVVCAFLCFISARPFSFRCDDESVIRGGTAYSPNA